MVYGQLEEVIYLAKILELILPFLQKDHKKQAQIK